MPLALVPFKNYRASLSMVPFQVYRAPGLMTPFLAPFTQTLMSL
jgi:hypothetical protein